MFLFVHFKFSEWRRFFVVNFCAARHGIVYSQLVECNLIGCRCSNSVPVFYVCFLNLLFKGLYIIFYDIWLQKYEFYLRNLHVDA